MSLETADERLSAYLEGELSPDEVAALEHELAHDADLRADLDAMRFVVDTFRDEGPVRAPLGFHAAVMDRIEVEHPEAPFWQRFLQRPFGIPAQGWGVVLAAAAVLLVVQAGQREGTDAEVDPDGPVWRDVPAEAQQAPAAVAPVDAASRKGPGGDSEDGGAEPAAEAEGPAVPPKATRPREEARSTKGVPPAPASEEAPPAADTDSEGASQSADAPVLRSPPTGLTLNTRDPSALRAVLSLVGSFGGTVTTQSGEEVTKGVLEQSEVVVIVRVPVSQMAAFQKALESYGTVRTAFQSDRLYSGDTVRLPLTVRLVGGSTGTGDKPLSPASRKSYQEADLLESPD